jgi:hypothetical protein
MLRCRDSLTAYRAGAGAIGAPEPRADSRLGAPGAFITEPALAWESYLRYRKHELIARVFDPRTEVPGFRQAARGVAILVGCFAGTKGGPKIACSHDTVIAALLSWGLGRRLEHEEWPNFFEGLVLRLHQDSEGGVEGVRLHYRGETHERALLGLDDQPS